MKDEDKKVLTFEITPSLLKSILVIITFSLILYFGINHFGTVLSVIRWFLSVVAPFIIGVSIAFVINILLKPMEKLWDKIFKNKNYKCKRSVLIIFSTLIVLGIIFAVVFMIVPQIKNAVQMFLETLPQNISKTNIWVKDVIGFLGGLGIKIPSVELDINEIFNTIKNFFSVYGSGVLGKTADITVSFFSWIVNIVLGFTFSIYMLSSKETLINQIKKSIYAFLPKQNANRIIEVSAFTGKTFANFVTGQLLEAVIIGVLCFIGMLIFRFPYALIISVLVGITALIPVVGAFIGTFVGAFLILLISPLKALWFIIFVIVLQQIEGNLIYPRVVGKSVGLPGIWVLASVTVFGRLFGITGMLFSVPVVSVLYALFKTNVEKRLKIKKIEI